jgi:hypothetical protein
VILILFGTPTRVLYMTADDLANIDAKLARHQILKSVSPLRSEVGGENAHFTAQLRDSAEAAELMEVPPLGVAVEFSHDGEVLLSGVVSSVRGGADGFSLEIQA